MPDEDLLHFGAPRPLLPAIRAIHREESLNELAEVLPGEVAEALRSLATGASVAEVAEALELREPEGEVDTEDFERVLAHPQSQRRFRLVADDHELAAILDAPSQRWRTFLHPSQRKLVKMAAKGPVRVLGGAGTGKTVALLHRAVHLLRAVHTGPEERVLVTTFTRNLAAELRGSLEQMLDVQTERLEVNSLDGWAVGFLCGRGQSFRFDHDAECQRDRWIAAIGKVGGQLPAAFYPQEWSRVVQARGLSTRDAYRRTSRKGRGLRLDRAGRDAVWEVFEEYRLLLTEEGFHEMDDVIRLAADILEAEGPPFRAVLAEEVQDLTPLKLRLLRALAPKAANDLFLVGDPHQRISGQLPEPFSKLGIDIRGRGRRLKLNCRTTQRIQADAVWVLEGQSFDDLDGGTDTLAGFQSLREGRTPKRHLLATEREEVATVLEQLRA